MPGRRPTHTRLLRNLHDWLAFGRAHRPTARANAANALRAPRSRGKLLKPCSGDAPADRALAMGAASDGTVTIRSGDARSLTPDGARRGLRDRLLDADAAARVELNGFSPSSRKAESSVALCARCAGYAVDAHRADRHAWRRRGCRAQSRRRPSCKSRPEARPRQRGSSRATVAHLLRGWQAGWSPAQPTFAAYWAASARCYRSSTERPVGFDGSRPRAT